MKKSSNRILRLILLIIIVPAGLNAQKQPGTWDLQYSLSGIYDNNILRYSDKYLGRFNIGTDAGRFYINNTDGIVLRNEIELEKKLNVFGHKAIPSVDIFFKNYVGSSIKDFWMFDLGWRQWIATKTSFKINFSYLPYYYVKHFRDKDLIPIFGYSDAAFAPFEFSKKEISGFFRNHLFTNTQMTIFLAYSYYKHNENFREFDSNDYLAGLLFRQELSRKVKVKIGFNFSLSEAKGYDQPGENKTNSDDIDASFNEHCIYAGAELKLPDFIFFNNSFYLTGYYDKRIYRSDKPVSIDQIHPGRMDNYFDVYAMYKVFILPYFDFSMIFSWQRRSSWSDNPANSVLISDEKDYDSYNIGLRGRYRIKF